MVKVIPLTRYLTIFLQTYDDNDRLPVYMKLVYLYKLLTKFRKDKAQFPNAQYVSPTSVVKERSLTCRELL